jgi:hypothetical protein
MRQRLRAGGVLQEDRAQTGARERPERQRKTAMEYFAGLDVAMEESAICVIDLRRISRGRSR